MKIFLLVVCVARTSGMFMSDNRTWEGGVSVYKGESINNQTQKTWKDSDLPIDIRKLKDDLGVLQPSDTEQNNLLGNKSSNNARRLYIGDYSEISDYDKTESESSSKEKTLSLKSDEDSANRSKPKAFPKKNITYKYTNTKKTSRVSFKSSRRLPAKKTARNTTTRRPMTLRPYLHIKTKYNNVIKQQKTTRPPVKVVTLTPRAMMTKTTGVRTVTPVTTTTGRVTTTTLTTKLTQKKSKLEKLKDFMEKNQMLIKKIVKKNMMEFQKDNVAEMRASKDKIHEKLIVDIENEEQTPKQGLRQRFTMVDPGDASRPPLPGPKHIDMIHAKGGKVQAWRSKGRLCSRNVMNLEGPRYDSKGNIYLRGFSREGRLAFPNTKQPKVVLPQCCNCCKKSVLGCE